jgi:hypothetical protein
MPIIPRREIPQTEIPALPAMAVPEADLTMANVLAQSAKIVLNVGSAASTIMAKRQRVEDATEMAKRTMLAETDIDAILDNIRQDRSVHPKAPDTYQSQVSEASKKWTKDLRGDLSAVLIKNMTPRVLQGLKTSREIKNKYLIEDSQATLNATEQAMIDRAGRLDVTPEQAFDPLFHTYEHMEGGLTEAGTPIPMTSREMNGAYVKYVNSLVESSLLKPEEAEKRIRETLDQMAYRRVQRMAISDNPGIVQSALDLLDREEGSRGSTFASVLSAEHRNDLRKAAQGQRDHLKHQAQSDADRSDRLARQRQQDIDAQQKATDLGEIGVLVIGILRGEKGFEDLNRLLIYNHELSTDPTKQEQLHNLIETRAQKGTTNWTLYNQIWREIWSSRGATDYVGRIVPLTAKTGGIARDDAEKLIATGRLAAENSVFKDDFFQAGQRDIDRNLMPPVGVIDEARQRRYAEASREFFDLAVPLIQSGKREQIPTLAREITDRWLKQAPQVTAIAPRDVPAYPSKEETVRAWESRYGPDPRKWSPAQRAEFNRQIGIHDRLQPPPGEVSTSEVVRDKQSKKPSKLPNPIK